MLRMSVRTLREGSLYGSPPRNLTDRPGVLGALPDRGGLMDDSMPPSSLRTYLDQGGDLAALGNPFVAQLAELVVADRRLFGFEQLAERERAADRDLEERKSERAASAGYTRASGKRLKAVVEAVEY